MTTQSNSLTWRDLAAAAGRLIFAGVFGIGVTFKFIGMGATADYIAAAGFPLPLMLAWLAAALDVVLIACFASGAFFLEASLVAAVYVLFLGFAFHGPSRWADNEADFGFFVDHFTFFAGLLFAAAHGPGRLLTIPRLRLLPA